MPDGRLATTDHQEDAAVTVRHRHASSTAIADRLARPHSREEAEERYVGARDSWAAAMRAANSGKPSDMAALAIAQDAYESALAERARWASSPRTPIPIEADRPAGIGAVVGQELSWRRVHEIEEERKQPTGIRRLLRRITRR
jgi:hypothetical protein